MDLNRNAYRFERTQLDVRFAGVDYEHKPVSQKDLRLCLLAKLILHDDFTVGADRLEVHD
jgi:hypothetical protein